MWDGSFHFVQIRGAAGEILWGYRPAATFKRWTIRKGGSGQWILTARLVRVEPFAIRQTPLLFTAPREETRDGFWAWGVESVQVGDRQLVARLGPPEQ
ncbi:MAG TPA: hypothetical protein VGP77_13065 [Vicinamibacterales bacterium]|nr:hypothetical protein [Vicinamibacterales bacterium]